MAKAEWGAKRTCHSCGARFYDLRRERIVCPVCGAVHDPDRQPRPRRAGPSIKEEPALPPHAVSDDVAVESLDEDLVETDADADLEDLDDPQSGEANNDELAKEEGALIEDASELGEDDDDIGEVMEHVDNELDDKA